MKFYIERQTTEKRLPMIWQNEEDEDSMEDELDDDEDTPDWD
jgi:hypothetical protein